VERTLFGFFIKDLLLGGGALAAVFLVFVLTRRFRKTRSPRRLYENIPYKERVYYEIMDDIIYQMRQRDGDAVFRIISAIPGLTVNRETGRVEDIKGDPSSITSQLIKHFEDKHNIHVNFSFAGRKPASIIRKH
jgi:hypothetical protein